jgi:hypothetical protein
MKKLLPSIPVIWITAGFAVIGVMLLLVTRAATPFASVEPENGTITAPATKITDTTAAGGAAVKFGSATPTPPPTPPPSSETAFTLAIIPDTQVEVSSTGSIGRFNSRLEWLVSNKSNLNLKYVWQVGDLQDWDDATHSHYERASTGLKILEQASIPYALSVGNHDTAAVCAGGSACPGVDVPTAFRNIPTWDQYYPASRFPGIKTLCEEFATYNTRLMAVGPSGTGLHTPTYVRNQCQTANTTANAYRTFTAGGLKWLLINYEMWPRQVVQEWMKTVAERHTDHNVIFFTHMHLSGGSTSLSTDFGGYGSPQGSPKAVYDNVISQFSNVRIVSSGHTGTSGCAVFTGPKGNMIYSYLNNRKDGSPPPNHVRLLKINTSSNSLTSQEYVPQTGETFSQAANCNASNVTWVR